MKVLYFDCIGGISGDMVLGAFIDAGVPLKFIERELGRLRLPGFRLRARKVKKHGISATKFDCLVTRNRHFRDFKALEALVKRSKLPEPVKKLSVRVFTALCRAESSVHGATLRTAHLHETGDTDSVVDVVGTAICANELGIDNAYCSEVPIGNGTIASRHGMLPLPVPATVKLLKGFDIRFTGIGHELTTPTGAAILNAFVRPGSGRGTSCTCPAGMRIERDGYGAGGRELAEVPNVLRLLIGEAGDECGFDGDEVAVMETNIDDQPPANCGFLLEKLIREGALDAYLTPIIMKKTRPAYTLTVLAPPQAMKRLAGTVFRESGTLGLRYRLVRRLKLKRDIIGVKTRFGPIRMKIGYLEGSPVAVSPEYEDCVRAATASGAALRKVQEEACAKSRRLTQRQGG